MNLLRTFLISGLALASFSAKAFVAEIDTSKNLVDAAKITYKLSDAKHKLYERNYGLALLTYKEILALDKRNSKAMYGAGECYFNLLRYSEAAQYFEAAAKEDRNVNKELEYMLGSAYFRLAKHDEALKHFESFRATIHNEKKLHEYDIDLLIAQVKYSKEQMIKPNNLKIVNIGSAINSKTAEYGPCISPDGKSLAFTSRREDTYGGYKAENFDHDYYSDVYISHWNEEKQAWDPAENIDGKINTEFWDDALSFTSEGDLLIYRNIDHVTGSGDIYVSKMSKTGKWGSPKAILNKSPKDSKKINSTYFESSASMTYDGKKIFFVSERPHGQGQADIWMIEEVNKVWSEPINLGPKINTGSDEKCVFVHPSGKVLFFSSNGHTNSIGSYDLYYSILQPNGQWGEPQNFGYPVNTTLEEKSISISYDGKTAFISAYYPTDNFGNSDIYTIDISSLGLDVTIPEAPKE